MRVNPEKVSRTRAHIVGAAALAGIVMAVGAQRRHGQDTTRNTIDRDISRTTRIRPDGGRINGSWVALNFDDQEMVDLAQSVHSVIIGGGYLPPIARTLLHQRSLELERFLRNRRSGQGGPEVLASRLLCEKLVSLSAALESEPDDGPRAVPLTDIDRDRLAKLIESAIYPLCVWDQTKLQELFVNSDKSLAAPRL